MEACSKHRLKSSYLSFFTCSNSFLHVLASFLLVSKATKKKLLKLLHNKPLSKYTEQICIVCHNKHEGKYLLHKKVLIHIEGAYQYYGVSFQISNGGPNLRSWDVFNLLYATFVWNNEQNSSNSFCKLGSLQQHQHLPVTASELLGFLNMLKSGMFFEDTSSFAVMLMSEFWTIHICSFNYLRKM